MPQCINYRLSGKRGALPAPILQPVSPRIDNVRAPRGPRQESRTLWKAGALPPRAPPRNAAWFESAIWRSAVKVPGLRRYWRLVNAGRLVTDAKPAGTWSSFKAKSSSRGRPFTRTPLELQSRRVAADCPSRCADRAWDRARVRLDRQRLALAATRSVRLRRRTPANY